MPTESVECDAIRRAFAEGRSLTEQERQHAEQCPSCNQLVAGDHELGQALGQLAEPSSETVPRDLLQRVSSTLEHERGFGARLKALATPARLAVALVLAAGILAGVGVTKTRPDWAVYPTARMVLVLSLFILPLAAAIGELLRPMHVPASPSRRLTLLAVVALILPVVANALPAAHFLHPASTEGVGSDFAYRAVACFAFGSALAVPIVLALVLLDRRSTVPWPALWLTAAAGGLTGNLALQLHCPITHPAHLLAGHATVGLGLAGAYALARPLFERARNPG